MPSPVNGWRLKMGTAAFTTAQTVAAVAHGLPAAPTFVLVGVPSNPTEDEVTVTSTATTITLTRVDTQAPQTVSYLIAVE